MKLRKTGIIGLFWVFMLVLMLPISHLPLTAANRILVTDLTLLLVILVINHTIIHAPLKFKSPFTFSHQLWVSVVPVIYVLLILMGVSTVGPLPARQALQAIAPAFSIAAYEEIFFRGIVLGGLLRIWGTRHLLTITFVSSLLFSLSHLLNLTHQSLLSTGFQATSALAIGLLFAAVYLRTDSLWWPIAGHFLNDFLILAASGSLSSSGPIHYGIQIAVSGGELVIAIVTTAWLLRPEERFDIQQKFHLA